jgi:hypothetical protein
MVQEWLRGSIWVLSYYNGFPIDPYWWYVWTPPPSFMHLIYHHQDSIGITNQVECIPKMLSFARRKAMKRPNLYIQAMSIIPPDSEYSVSTKRLGWDTNSSHPRQLFTPDYRDMKHLKYSIIWAQWSHECPVQLPLLELPYIVHSLTSLRDKKRRG